MKYSTTGYESSFDVSIENNCYSKMFARFKENYILGIHFIVYQPVLK